MNSIAKNLAEIKSNISSKPEAKLVAVSKYASVREIRAAYDLGIRDFGENKVQSALQKSIELADLKINWHFLGHLQTNKVKQALEIFDWIHSVDSLKLLKLISRISQEHQKTINLCFQVKLVPDQNKYGLSQEELFELLKEFLSENKEQSCLKLKGLMTILPLSSLEETFEQRVRIFSSLKALKEKVNQEFGLDLTELSMGMSNDYKEALQAGATILRIGSALFQK